MSSHLLCFERKYNLICNVTDDVMNELLIQYNIKIIWLRCTVGWLVFLGDIMSRSKPENTQEENPDSAVASSVGLN